MGKTPPWAIVLCACLPLAACPVAPAMFVATVGRHEVAETFQQGGFFVYLVILAFVLAVMVTSVSGALLARGARLPVAVPLFFAVLPWLVGDAGLRSGMSALQSALAMVNPADKAVITAAGLGEASVNRFFGALLASVLLGFFGLALSVAAAARSSQPSATGAAVGLAASAPMLAAALLVPSLRDAGFLGFLPALPAVCAAVGLCVASRAASADSPHARSAALAATATVPFGLAFTGAAVAAVISQTSKAFHVLAVVAPADRLTVGIAAVAEMRPLITLSTWGWALAVVPLLGAGGWALMRGAALKAPVLEVAACAAILALVAGADFSASRAMNQAVSGLAEKPWARRPGFRPVLVAGPRSPVGVLVAPDFIERVGGERVPKPFDGSLEPLSNVLRADPTHVVALDARLSLEQLKKVFAGVGVESLQLAGDPVRSVPIAASSSVDPAAWMVKVLDGPATVGLELVSLYPEDAVRVKVGPRGLETPLAQHPSHVYLEPRDDLTVDGLVAACVTLREAGVMPTWVTAEPGSRGSSLASIFGDSGLGSGLQNALGTAPQPEPLLRRRDAPPQTITGATPVVMGSLDPEFVRMVVHRNRGQLRYCFEKRLMAKPSLHGKVTAKFVITATGTIGQVQIAQSTAHDAELEECIKTRVRTWVFPKPKGGGVAIVSYPFVFEQAD